MSKFPGWPAWRYNSEGEGRIFQSEAEVPKGWTANPFPDRKTSSTEEPVKNKSTAKKPFSRKKQTAEPFPRAEVMAALKEAGIVVKDSISDDDLRELALEEL